MAKVNWDALFLEYVNSERSIAGVLSSHNLSPSCGGNKAKTASWGTEKAQIRHEIAENARKDAVQAGAAALASMDVALFSLGSLAMHSLRKYVETKQVLSPKETQTVLEMVLLRLNKPTKHVREEQAIPDLIPDELLEKLKNDVLNKTA